MTCQDCGYSVIATRMHETPHHAAGCKNAGEQNPWLQLADVLQALKVGAGETAVDIAKVPDINAELTMAALHREVAK